MFRKVSQRSSRHNRSKKSAQMACLQRLFRRNDSKNEEAWLHCAAPSSKCKVKTIFLTCYDLGGWGGVGYDMLLVYMMQYFLNYCTVN